MFGEAPPLMSFQNSSHIFKRKNDRGDAVLIPGRQNEHQGSFPRSFNHEFRRPWWRLMVATLAPGRMEVGRPSRWFIAAASLSSSFPPWKMRFLFLCAWMMRTCEKRGSTFTNNINKKSWLSMFAVQSATCDWPWGLSRFVSIFSVIDKRFDERRARIPIMVCTWNIYKILRATSLFSIIDQYQ